MPSKPINWRTYKPKLYCRSFGGSDYCQWCGRDMCDSRPCEYLQEARYALIPEDEIIAFGCAFENAMAQAYAEAGIVDDDPFHCEKWCRKSGCPFALKDMVDELVL
jgi:hypothetical protein